VGLIARDILLMQRSQFILGGLVIVTVVDWRWPAMNRSILGAPAAWADVLDFIIDPRVSNFSDRRTQAGIKHRRFSGEAASATSPALSTIAPRLQDCNSNANSV
jgi:hypothetical protein